MTETSETVCGEPPLGPCRRGGAGFKALHLSGIILLVGIGVASHATVSYRSPPVAGGVSPGDLRKPSRILDPNMVGRRDLPARGVPADRAGQVMGMGGTDIALPGSAADPGLSAYLDILPGAVIIPAAEPDMANAKTVADVAGGDADQPVAGYVLGEDGMSPEMEAAFRVIQRGRAPATVHEDANVFREAAAEIGYVPAGVDPNAIRTPGAELGVSGKVVRGPAEVITGHLLALGGGMIRLQGARAPGAMDVCLNAAGVEYDCASWARAGLEHILRDRDLACEVTDEPHPEGGMIGWCNLEMAGGAGRDLAELAVLAGILVPDRGDDGFSPYDGDEREAKTNGVGVWSGSFSPRKQ